MDEVLVRAAAAKRAMEGAHADYVDVCTVYEQAYSEHELATATVLAMWRKSV